MSDFYNHMGGCGFGSSPCANCESEPQRSADMFCSDECRHEYEGCPEGVPPCSTCLEG